MSHARLTLGEETGPREAHEILRHAGQALAAEVHKSDGEAAAGGFSNQLDELVAALPAGARLLAPSGLAPFHLLLHAARGRLDPARAAFHQELESLVDAARRHFGGAATKDASHAPQTMGELGSRFFDAERLAETTRVASHSGHGDQDLGDAVKALEEKLADDVSPALILVHDGDHGVAGLDELAADVLFRRHADPVTGAAELFDRQAEMLAAVLRAARRLRLELDGEYDAARHDPWLEQLDWQAMSREELALLTPVVALVTADQTAGAEMAALSRLLLSGRPVQIVVLDDPAASPGAGEDPFSGFRFEVAHLGLSHREVVVQQSSLARPVHLARGFSRALAAPLAALHVLSRPRQGSLDSGAPELAALEARAHPLLDYDPERGTSWDRRLDLGANPAPAAPWPSYAIDLGEGPHEVAFTFADWALLQPRYGDHFCPVPDGFEGAELVPMAEWSAAGNADNADLPFIWAIDGDGAPRRLVVSRPLAFATRDRLDFWQTLQELAGIESSSARRTVEAARHETKEEGSEQRVRLADLDAEDLERLRREAAEEVVEHLTSSLLDIDPASLAAMPPAAGRPLSGRVDEVAAALRQLVGPETLKGEKEPPPDARVARMAAELMRVVGAG